MIPANVRSFPRFVTIGPDTNHDFATRRYLDFLGVNAEALGFVEHPEDGFAALLQRTSDFFVLCSVHPETPGLLCRFAGRAFIVDTFVSASKPMAIATRRDVSQPSTIGLFAATVGLAPTDAWRQTIVETRGTLATMGKNLLAGAYDSAIVYREFAETHADRLRIDIAIESPDDAWLVLSASRATGGTIVANPTGPVAIIIDRADRAK
jgi:hypothetical protein